MGNSDSTPLGLDKPEPLMEEAQRNIVMGFHDAAVVKYRRAYELLKESGALAGAARALRLAAEAGLLGAAPDFDLAAKAFEEVGLLYLKNELTAFSAAAALANAVFCLLAAGRAATASEKFDEFKKLDGRLESGCDGVATKVILEAFTLGNKNQVKDLGLSYREVVASWPPWREAVFKRIIERLS
jgi:tetratricopeptide (TPR) repeat protein